MEAFCTSNKWKLLGDQKRDLSPPRRACHNSSDSSPPRRACQDSSDSTPPRRTHHDSLDSSDSTPPKKVRHDSPDTSPHKKTHHDSSHFIPSRRVQHDSPDSSPLRRSRHDSPDLSPPRRGHEARHPVSSKAPAKSSLHLKEKSSRHGDEYSPHQNRSSSSLQPGKELHDDRSSSPNHRKFHRNPSSKKHHRHNIDSSFLGKSSQHASDSDLSPPRNKEKGDSHSDLSPPRRKQRSRSSDSDLSPVRRSQPSGTKATQMFSGAKTGLVSDVRREQQELRRQDRQTKHLDAEFQNAETIFRDKSGRKRHLKLERLEQRRKEEEESEKNEQYAQWGKGLAQSREQQQNLEDAMKEMQKPLARYIYDDDLDQMLRERQREGDPMAHLIKKKKAKENKVKKERPRYDGPEPPLNRFNIWPGYRWDGVDRSNGFEEKRFSRIASKRALEELAYKWSIEDM